MEVYEFDKNLLTRLQESQEVLCWKDAFIPAGRVQAEWSYFIELQIEPTGWRAIWKVPRVICEDFGIRYPTIVCGIVNQVLFKELKATFTISEVENDDSDVQLPEPQIVRLEDLWPTKKQDIPELNVERTANCIDQLRFFYNNIWMPWDYDNDDDLNWAEKHLESRIRFHYDLKRKVIKNPVGAYIKSLLAEARYIQSKREYLEIDIPSDNDDDNDDDVNGDSKLNKSHHITDLMRLHLRITMIKSEIELLENPTIRKAYEEVKFNEFEKNSISNIYVVLQANAIEKQIEYLERAKNFLNNEKIVRLCPSLQEALNLCKNSEEIFVTPGCHQIKYFEHFNDNSKIIGLTNENTSSNDDKSITITSQDDDNSLLIFDGNSELSNITFDCKNVRTGILIKSGNVIFNNCRIYGDKKSSTNYAVTVSGKAKIILNNCIIENFSVAISLMGQAEFEMNHTKLENCKIGVEMKDETFVKFHESSIIHAKNGLWFETKLLSNKISEKKLIFEDLRKIQENYCNNIPWCGNPKFVDCTRGNVAVLNMKHPQFPFLDENDCSDDSFYQCETDSSGLIVDSSVIMVDDSMTESIKSTGSSIL